LLQGYNLSSVSAMSDAPNFDVSTTATSPEEPVSPLIAPTVLASALVAANPDLPLKTFCSTETIARFSSPDAEVRALLQASGVFDLGWRTRIQVTGEDRLRWLSGMVTNAVQQLPEQAGNYSFFLNAQGRIQGDAYVYRDKDRLLLDTSKDQAEAITAHLDRFIIMDDVTLENLQSTSYSLGLSGPQAAQLLTNAGISLPATSAENPIQFAEATFDSVNITVAALPGELAPHYEIFCNPADAAAIWKQLVQHRATPCGIEAVEALRVIEGLPRYGVDLHDRDLPQETSQARALNFNKGCYLGQEIVERIRSRGAVHKGLRQFSLQGTPPALPADLLADGTVIGRLTSAVSVDTSAGPIQRAIGIVRVDAMSAAATLTYNGGVALPLDRPQAIPC
jgi:folate-binding protein YgfZ